MARHMDLIYHTLLSEIPQFGTRTDVAHMTYADAVGMVQQVGTFVQRVTRWYGAALEQMEYCPFCGATTPPHGERCPMALIVEKDTVFVVMSPNSSDNGRGT